MFSTVSFLALLALSPWACTDPYGTTEQAVIDPATPWVKHTVAASLNGADGHVSADLTGDGLPDLVVGWEESSKVTAYAAPDWTLLASYNHSSVEDVLACDLDLDGAPDILSFGEDKKIRAARNLGGSFAAAIVIGAATNVEQWTTGACGAVGGDGRRYVYAGGRVASAGKVLGVYRFATTTPWVAASWTRTLVTPAGWTMTLDVYGDGLFLTDRLQAAPTVNGVRLITPLLSGWTSTQLAAVADGCLPRFGSNDGTDLLWGCVKESDQTSKLWLNGVQVPYPAPAGPYQDSVLADFNQDGNPDIAVTTGEVGGNIQPTTWPGVFLLLGDGAGGWTFAAVSGPTGGKWDEIEARDTDGDGDLDITTTEQRLLYGAVIYENPL